METFSSDSIPLYNKPTTFQHVLTYPQKLNLKMKFTFCQK